MTTLHPQPCVPDEDWHQLTSPHRLPGLGAEGRAMLMRLRGHPSAPLFRNFSGHRLGPLGRWLARWRRLRLLRRRVVGAAPGSAPLWTWRFVWQHLGRIDAWPAARELLRGWPGVPTTHRGDLQRDLPHHVPRDRQGPELLCFTTSGTTGHPIRVPTLPRVAADYLALHERALKHFGVELRAGRGDVGIVLAGFQQRCFTYVSVNPLRGECGVVKLNLHPTDWRDPGDRARYLDDLRPELISGDPVSLAELARLPLVHRPRALLSTSMALHGGFRQRLQAQFGCPVLDLYSITEVGPIGVFVDEADGFVLLQPELFVEIVDARGHALPPGAHGEITVTGGFNPCLPLLRYRTGDHARLVITPLGPTLRDLQGRPPVRLRAHDGRWVNNVDVTQALRGLDLQRFSLHQHANGHLSLNLCANTSHQAPLQAELRARLQALLGEWPLEIGPMKADDKVRQYTSDVDAADAHTAPPVPTVHLR